MCFGSGSSSTTTSTTTPQETAAIEAQTAYRKQQINRVNAYNQEATDVVGSIIGSSAANNNNASAPSTALKKLMGG